MKKLTMIMAIILIAGLLAGCGVTPEQSLLDYIVADPDWTNLTVGGTQQLTITAYYEDETYADVTSDCDYCSNYPDIATVDREGLITAVGVIGEGAWIEVYYYQENDFTNLRERFDKIGVTIIESEE